MSGEPNPIFVERETYRRRRLVDAARLLPILGVALVCLPLLWTGERDVPAKTTYTMIYIFGIWVALVMTAAVLSRHLGAAASKDETEEDASPDRSGGAG